MKNNNKELEAFSVQSFACLIVIDHNLDIVGITQEALLLNMELSQHIGLKFTLYLNLQFGVDSKSFLDSVTNILDNNLERHLTSISIHNKLYYLKTTKKDNHIYIEWERQYHKNISASELNELGFLFEQTKKFDWTFLCKGINMLLKFDRLIILKVHETGQSQVIAEFSEREEQNYLHQIYDCSFLPVSDHGYFTSAPYRYISNRKESQLFYTNSSDLDMSVSQIIKTPIIQEKFFQYKNIESAIFFPLIVHDKLWGMVVGHNNKKTKVDLQKRKLCTFIVQNALSKYENFVTKEELDQNELIFKTELKLKSEFNLHNTSNCLIVNNLTLILDLTQSDGIAVYNQGDIFIEGTTPTLSQINEIVHYLRLHNDKPIFKDFNFKLKRKQLVTGELAIAGIMAAVLDQDYYILWFRKEHQTNIFNWSANPVHQELDNIHVQEHLISNSAIPWNDREISFVQKLQNIIKDFIISKSKERQLQTEDLVRLNNELEMFTYTLSHDLKNPLSVLKMGIQFLHNNGANLSHEEQKKWFVNLLGNVSNIDDIINNIVKLSNLKSSGVHKEPISMNYMLHKIVQEVQLLYGNANTKVTFEKLYPIWGEKSTLYQIFLNIVGNAIKYSSTKEHPEVTIKSLMDKNQICYIVSDNGIGIPNNKRNQIFEMFGRADNALNFKGTGVGMSLVKRIMDRMKGNIKVKSTLGKGTEIYLYFPIEGNFPPSMLDNI